MAFISMSDQCKKNSFQSGHTNYRLSVSVIKQNRKNQPASYSATFKIRDDLAKEARLIVGDTVDILFDSDDNTGLITRKNSQPAWKLSPNTNRKDLRVSMTHRGIMPLPLEKMSITECEVVSVDEQGILFVWPKPVNHESTGDND